MKDFKKDFENISGTRVSLTNNEIKYIMIVIINSLENREILTKETTTKITGQKRGFLNFLNDNWFTINEKCSRAIR